MPKLGSKEVGSTGFGLMGLTWRNPPPPQAQAFEAMKSALTSGANAWNGGEFYGTPEYNSLHMLKEYFTKYPEDAGKVHLNVKGAAHPEKYFPEGSRAGVRRSVENCVKLLGGKKSLDTFECARVDPNTPIEETLGYLGECVKEGLIGGIGLSEVRAETIRRAAKVQKIDSVEVEFSLFATDILTNGVAKTCAELHIPILAYSPLGRGMLTGQIKSVDQVPDQLKPFPRFQPDVFPENLKLVAEVETIAKQKGCTPGQVAMAWVKHWSGRGGMPVIIPIPGTTTADRVSENMKDVELSDQDLKIIADALNRCEVKGDRYPGHVNAFSWG